MEAANSQPSIWHVRHLLCPLSLLSTSDCFWTTACAGGRHLENNPSAPAVLLIIVSQKKSKIQYVQSNPIYPCTILRSCCLCLSVYKRTFLASHVSALTWMCSLTWWCGRRLRSAARCRWPQPCNAARGRPTARCGRRSISTPPTAGRGTPLGNTRVHTGEGLLAGDPTLTRTK